MKRIKPKDPRLQTQLGKSPTGVTRAKMSASSKGKPKTPEHRAAISAAKRGRKHSKATRAEVERLLEEGKPQVLIGVLLNLSPGVVSKYVNDYYRRVYCRISRILQFDLAHLN